MMITVSEHEFIEAFNDPPQGLLHDTTMEDVPWSIEHETMTFDNELLIERIEVLQYKLQSLMTPSWAYLFAPPEVQAECDKRHMARYGRQIRRLVDELNSLPRPNDPLDTFD